MPDVPKSIIVTFGSF